MSTQSLGTVRLLPDGRRAVPDFQAWLMDERLDPDMLSFMQSCGSYLLPAVRLEAMDMVATSVLFAGSWPQWLLCTEVNHVEGQVELTTSHGSVSMAWDHPCWMLPPSTISGPDAAEALQLLNP